MTGRSDGWATLVDRVVEGGHCVGCGVCAAAAGASGHMRLDHYGCYRPDALFDEGPEPAGIALWEVCPFAGNAAAEDRLAEVLFGARCARDAAIGYHAATWVGSVSEGEFRRCGSRRPPGLRRPPRRPCRVYAWEPAVSTRASLRLSVSVALVGHTCYDPRNFRNDAYLAWVSAAMGEAGSRRGRDHFSLERFIDRFGQIGLGVDRGSTEAI